ncbi:hypothetical protein [Falsibacillus pallidus]|uniref:Uncharacterized protein n=1 Tax=Falsibacillus pallidus TaxID=493781 RepID=A0A370G5S3_9BACI|nr:hypothetical protein [Falsibacillus pallidus]RDI39115.1 hypothetical protein DFR59_11522 [Falsibacillus pallidus]
MKKMFTPSMLLQRFGVFSFFFGILATAVTMYDFSDKNIYLMVSIGFIVGGVQTMIIGAAFQSMQQHPKQEKVREDVLDNMNPSQV